MNRSRHSSLSQTMAQMKRRYNARSNGGSAAPRTPYTPSGMPPVADAGDDQTVDFNSTTNSVDVDFDGSASYDPDDGTNPGDGIVSYEWDFGDGDSSTDTVGTSSHTYTAPGTYTVELTVTDDENERDSDTMTVAVKAPPVADAGADQTVELDSNTNSVSVSFDGSNSYDPDGGPLTYAWSFGDGDDSTGSGETPSHTYTSTGTYVVFLTVTDDENETDIDTLIITVAEVPAVALTLTGPDTVTRGDSTTYSATITPAGLTLDATPTFKWKYTATVRSDRDTVSITENINATAQNPQSTTWSGTMVGGGTLEVRTTVNGTEYVQTMDVTVTDRAWVTDVPITTDTTSWGTEAPGQHSDLGDVEYDMPFTAADDLEIAEVSSGPNKGILYIASLNLTAPFIVRINKHFEIAEADLPSTWVAFKEANSRYGEIESKVKARLGFDGTTSGTLYGSWESEIHYSDPKANLEEFMEVPGYLSDYETQIVYYVEYIQRSRKAGMDRQKSGWSPSGITINYNYLFANAGEDITVPFNVGGNTISFDGSGSYAPSGRTITAYAWDFGDPGSMENTADTAAATHTYNTPGAYTVELSVTDDQDNVVSDSLLITLFQGTVSISNNGLARSTPPISPTPAPTPTATIGYTVVPERTDFTPTSAAVEICNSQGTLVKEISLTNSTANSYTTLWDGSDNDGVPVPDGGYSVVGVVNHQASSHRSAVENVSVSGSGGESHVSILPESSSHLAVENQLGASGTNTQSTSSPPVASIIYSITLASDATAVKSATLEIRADDSVLIQSTLLGNTAGSRLQTAWDGRGSTNTGGNNSEGYVYGTYYARIWAVVTIGEGEDANDETLCSNLHAITVYSRPVADARGEKVVRLKTMDDATTGTTTTSAPANFNGMYSYDPDDGTGLGEGISKYSWSFPGGDPDSFESETESAASTEYSTVGEKTVTLTVTDNDPSPPLPAPRTHLHKIKVNVIKLTLEGPTSVTRGMDAQYTATVEPTEVDPTFNWSFYYDTDIEVSENTGTTNSWSGKMVKSGTLEVRATINDITFIERMNVVVNERTSWQTQILGPNVDNRTWGEARPTELHQLGRTQTFWNLQRSKETGTHIKTNQVESGPNKGFWYVTEATLRTRVEIGINKHFLMPEEQLPESWRDFRRMQGAPYVDYDDILLAVKLHEGVYGNIPEKSHYSYWHNDALKKGTPHDPARQLERFIGVPYMVSDKPYEELREDFYSLVAAELRRHIDEANRIWSSDVQTIDLEPPLYLPGDRRIWFFPE